MEKIKHYYSGLREGRLLCESATVEFMVKKGDFIPDTWKLISGELPKYEEDWDEEDTNDEMNVLIEDELYEWNKDPDDGKYKMVLNFAGNGDLIDSTIEKIDESWSSGMPTQEDRDALAQYKWLIQEWADNANFICTYPNYVFIHDMLYKKYTEGKISPEEMARVEEIFKDKDEDVWLKYLKGTLP